MAILIVAYRSADLLERCIASVDRFLPGHEIHVWDNSGPSHSSVRRLAARLPHVHWHLGSANIGFAAAVNKLAATLPEQDLLLINPDAELVSPLTMTRAAIGDPGTAAAAPMTVEPGSANRGSWAVSTARRPWDVAHRRLTRLNAIGSPLGLAERLRGTHLSDLYRSQPTDVDGYMTGACLAIRREAWERVGPFDEAFFLYGEEADWQRRALEAGWGVRLADEIGVRHRAHGTVSGDPVGFRRSKDLLRASVALQLEYRHGVRTAECYLAVVSLCDGLRQTIRGRRDRRPLPTDVLVTIDPSAESTEVSERVRLAMELVHDGRAVTVVCLQRIGPLPREVPESVRLLRRPWWWPSMSPSATPKTLVHGSTRRERAFAKLFRVRRNSRCIEATVAAAHLHVVATGRDNVASSRRAMSS